MKTTQIFFTLAFFFLILCCSSLSAQLSENGFRIINLEVNKNEIGQGIVFRRNSERVIISANHTLKGGLTFAVTSSTNGAGSEAVTPNPFESYDIATLIWPGNEFIEQLPTWKKPRSNFRNVIKKDLDFRLLRRDVDGQDYAEKVNITSTSENKLFITFESGKKFEEGMSGGALVLRPKSGKDIYLGMLYKRSNDSKTGWVYPADIMHDIVKRRMKEEGTGGFRKLVPILGYLGAGVAVGTGYLSTYQNAEEIYEVYKDNPQEGAYALLNTGFPTREAAYQESEDLRKKALRLYMVGGGLAVSTAIYQLLFKSPSSPKAADSSLKLEYLGTGLSIKYKF